MAKIIMITWLQMKYVYALNDYVITNDTDPRNLCRQLRCCSIVVMLHCSRLESLLEVIGIEWWRMRDKECKFRGKIPISFFYFFVLIYICSILAECTLTK